MEINKYFKQFLVNHPLKVKFKKVTSEVIKKGYIDRSDSIYIANMGIPIISILSDVFLVNKSNIITMLQSNTIDSETFLDILKTYAD